MAWCFHTNRWNRATFGHIWPWLLPLLFERVAVLRNAVTRHAELKQAQPKVASSPLHRLSPVPGRGGGGWCEEHLGALHCGYMSRGEEASFIFIFEQYSLPQSTSVSITCVFPFSLSRSIFFCSPMTLIWVCFVYTCTGLNEEPRAIC